MEDSLKISVKEVVEILDYHWDTNTTVFLLGPPGVGKSTAVRQFCIKKSKELKREFVEWHDIVGTNMQVDILKNPSKYFLLVDIKLYEYEPQDVKGFIYIDENKEETKIVPWDWMKFFYNPKGAGVIFLDELNMAHQDTLKVAFQLLYQRVLANKRIKAKTLLVAAGNSPEENYLVIDLPLPLLDRMAVYTVKTDILEWLEYAEKQGVNKYIKLFLTMYPEYLLYINQDTNEIVSPRSWCMLSNILNKLNLQKIKSNKLLQIVSGYLPKDVAHLFVSFVENSNKGIYTKWLKDYEKVLKQPNLISEYINDIEFLNGLFMYASTKYLNGDLNSDELIRIIEELYILRPELINSLLAILKEKVNNYPNGKQKLKLLLHKLRTELPNVYNSLVYYNL